MKLSDMLFANAMMGEGGGGGGGGGGDFTTAEVTVTYNALNSYYGATVAYVNNGYMLLSFAIETESAALTETYQLVLYNNTTTFAFDNGDPDYEIYTNIAVTGDITVDEEGFITVRGNGTITIS